MSNFYDKLPVETATEMERLSRLMYELRENRKVLLAQHEAADADALLAGIVEGRIDEHPAYEHYLGARILGAAHDTIRAQLRLVTSGREDPNPPPPLLHLELEQHITTHYAGQLQSPVQVAQDALLLQLVNGVGIELRFAAADAYAFTWQWGEAVQRIDTAPIHAELATAPHHWHDVAGELRADPVTDPARDAWDNTRAVIDALLADPLLRA